MSPASLKVWPTVQLDSHTSVSTSTHMAVAAALNRQLGRQPPMKGINFLHLLLRDMCGELWYQSPPCGSSHAKVSAVASHISAAHWQSDERSIELWALHPPLRIAGAPESSAEVIARSRLHAHARRSRRAWRGFASMRNTLRIIDHVRRSAVSPQDAMSFKSPELDQN